MAGIVLAALGVVVLGVAIAALRHPTAKSTSANTSSHVPSTGSKSSASAPAGTHPSTGSSSPPASQSSSTTQAAKSIPLVVLNNTTTTHLASDAATLFEGAGWKVQFAGNYTNNIASTCAYYDPSVPGAAAAAQLLQSEFPSIVRVKPKFAGLRAGPIVVVLTSDFKIA